MNRGTGTGDPATAGNAGAAAATTGTAARASGAAARATGAAARATAGAAARAAAGAGASDCGLCNCRLNWPPSSSSDGLWRCGLRTAPWKNTISP